MLARLGRGLQTHSGIRGSFINKKLSPRILFRCLLLYLKILEDPGTLRQAQGMLRPETSSTKKNPSRSSSHLRSFSAKILRRCAPQDKFDQQLASSLGLHLIQFLILKHQTVIGPNFDPNHSVHRISFRRSVIDIGTKCMKWHCPVRVDLLSSDVDSVQTS